MREIKFRGYSKILRMWIYGGYAKQKCNEKNEIRHYIIDDCEGVPANVWEDKETEYNLMYEEVDEKSIGEFTGFFDKKGKEIYEGDLVKYGNHIWEVRLADGCWVYALDYKYGTQMLPFNSAQRDNRMEMMELIGNIYEHSHLLESQNA